MFKRKAEVRNGSQKFLKVGQKFRSREIDRKRGFHDSRSRAEDRRDGVEEKLMIAQKKESMRGKLYVTLTNGRE